jgi:hypothetical protein
MSVLEVVCSLSEAAVDAMKASHPTLINGKPVEVDTTIAVEV